MEKETMKMVNRGFQLGVSLLILSASAGTAMAQALPPGSPLPMQAHSVHLVDGTQTTIGDLAGSEGTVFIFWSNQCRWVGKYEERVLALQAEYAGKGINFVLVNANDPDAFPQEAAAVGQAKNYPMPYVTDAGSQFAQGVGASRTPHVFAFDGTKTLVYVGTIDDSPGDPGNAQKTYLRDVLEALAQGGSVEVPGTKAFGCMIKFQTAGG
ncbi:MAG: redoxin family protein [Rhodothermales bacterium]